MEQQREIENNQFKELLKDKEEEIALLASQAEQNDLSDQFQELNKLLNVEKQKNQELSAKLESQSGSDDDVTFKLLQEENEKNEKLSKELQIAKGVIEEQKKNLTGHVSHQCLLFTIWPLDGRVYLF